VGNLWGTSPPDPPQTPWDFGVPIMERMIGIGCPKCRKNNGLGRGTPTRGRMQLRRTLGKGYPLPGCFPAPIVLRLGYDRGFPASRRAGTFLQAVASLPLQSRRAGNQLLSDTRARLQKIPRRSRASRPVAVLTMRTLQPDEPFFWPPGPGPGPPAVRCARARASPRFLARRFARRGPRARITVSSRAIEARARIEVPA
jgi:hypothetical protein